MTPSQSPTSLPRRPTDWRLVLCHAWRLAGKTNPRARARFVKRGGAARQRRQSTAIAAGRTIGTWLIDPGGGKFDLGADRGINSDGRRRSFSNVQCRGVEMWSRTFLLDVEIQPNVLEPAAALT
jgi:hypothetical protein